MQATHMRNGSISRTRTVADPFRPCQKLSGAKPHGGHVVVDLNSSLLESMHLNMHEAAHVVLPNEVVMHNCFVRKGADLHLGTRDGGDLLEKCQGLIWAEVAHRAAQPHGTEVRIRIPGGHSVKCQPAAAAAAHSQCYWPMPEPGL